jgi:hypothetical protein
MQTYRTSNFHVQMVGILLNFLRKWFCVCMQLQLCIHTILSCRSVLALSSNLIHYSVKFNILLSCLKDWICVYTIELCLLCVSVTAMLVMNGYHHVSYISISYILRLSASYVRQHIPHARGPFISMRHASLAPFISGDCHHEGNDWEIVFYFLSSIRLNWCLFSALVFSCCLFNWYSAICFLIISFFI